MPPAEFKRWTVARLISQGIVVYLFVWVVEFIFVARVFGVSRATAVSLIAAVPFLVIVRMRLQWRNVNALDLVPLAVVVVFAAWGTIIVVQSWRSFDEHFGIEARQERQE